MAEHSANFINTLQMESLNDTFTTDIRSSTSGANFSTGADTITNRLGVELISDSTSTDSNWNTTVSMLFNASSHIITNLQKHVTESIEITNNSHIPDVIIKPEVQHDVDFGTAEKVLIGTAAIIGSLTILSVVLRIIVPCFRSKEFKYDGNDVNEIKAGLEQAENKLSGYSNLGIDEISFHLTGNGSSHSSGSTPSTDWTDVSSDQKQPVDQSEGIDVNVAPKYHIQRPVCCEPLYLVAETGLPKSETSSSLVSKQPEEVISVISTRSLEPLRMEHMYRTRWDDHWNKDFLLPRGTLSHFSYPSDSRLSLTSHSTHSSGSGSRNSSTAPSGSYAVASTSSGIPESCHAGTLEFPIPSKAMVHQLHQEIDKRYPSSTRAAPPCRN